MGLNIKCNGAKTTTLWWKLFKLFLIKKIAKYFVSLKGNLNTKLWFSANLNNFDVEKYLQYHQDPTLKNGHCCAC